VQEVKKLEHYGEHMPVVGCVEQRTANLQDCIMIWRNIRRHVQCLGRVGAVTAVAAEAVTAVAAEAVTAVAAEVVLAVAAEVVLAIKKVAARRPSQGRELKDLIGVEEIHRRRKKLWNIARRRRKKGNSLERIVVIYCDLSAKGDVCGLCKESMQQCNKDLRKLLDATDKKLDYGMELSKIQEATNQLISSSNMRKMFDACDAPTMKKKNRVDEEDAQTFMDVCGSIGDAAQTKAAYETGVAGELQDEDTGLPEFFDVDEYVVQPSVLTSPKEKDMNPSISPDISPDMLIEEVVHELGVMSAKERGFDSHAEHSAQTNKSAKRSKKQADGSGNSVVRKRLDGLEQRERSE
jgi:hypothetical protein